MFADACILSAILFAGILDASSVAVFSGCTGANNALVAMFATLPPLAHRFSIAGIAASNHKLEAAHAVLATSDSFADVSANHQSLAHFEARFAHHSNKARASLAKPTGSSVIVLPRFSQLPYLSLRTWCHSFVVSSFHNQASVSAGFVMALVTALAVFTADHGILAAILTTFGQSVPAPTNWSI